MYEKCKQWPNFTHLHEKLTKSPKFALKYFPEFWRGHVSPPNPHRLHLCQGLKVLRDLATAIQSVERRQ